MGVVRFPWIASIIRWSAPGIAELERGAAAQGCSGGCGRARLPELVIAVFLDEELGAGQLLNDPAIVRGQMRIACIYCERLASRLGDLLGDLGVLVALNCGAQAKPRHHGIDGGCGMVPGPGPRRGLSGKRVVPGSLTQRLGEARLRLLVEALLTRQEGERRDQGDGKSNLPTVRWAQGEEMEEELHRPPFRHQIPLPIRRGQVV